MMNALAITDEGLKGDITNVSTNELIDKRSDARVEIAFNFSNIALNIASVVGSPPMAALIIPDLWSLGAACIDKHRCKHEIRHRKKAKLAELVRRERELAQEKRYGICYVIGSVMGTCFGRSDASNEQGLGRFAGQRYPMQFCKSNGNAQIGQDSPQYRSISSLLMVLRFS